MKGINQVVFVSNYGMIRISLHPGWPSVQPSYTNADEVGDRYEHLQVDLLDELMMDLSRETGLEITIVDY